MANKLELKIVGRLGQDVEMKYTSGGAEISKFSVALSHSKKGDDGKWVTTSTTWVSCTAWGNIAEQINGKFNKGQLVSVVGDMIIDKNTGFLPSYDKDGQKNYRIEIKVSSIELADTSQSQSPKSEDF
jgi:single-strand DNA-binding protein